MTWRKEGRPSTMCERRRREEGWRPTAGAGCACRYATGLRGAGGWGGGGVEGCALKKVPRAFVALCHSLPLSATLCPPCCLTALLVSTKTSLYPAGFLSLTVSRG